MNRIQINIIDQMSDIALQQLRLMEKYSSVVQMFFAEDVGSVTQEDLATLSELSHVTPAELTAAKNAMDSIQAALGGYAVGTNATKLSKIVKNLP